MYGLLCGPGPVLHADELKSIIKSFPFLLFFLLCLAPWKLGLRDTRESSICNVVLTNQNRNKINRKNVESLFILLLKPKSIDGINLLPSSEQSEDVVVLALKVIITLIFAAAAAFCAVLSLSCAIIVRISTDWLNDEEEEEEEEEEAKRRWNCGTLVYSLSAVQLCAPSCKLRKRHLGPVHFPPSDDCFSFLHQMLNPPVRPPAKTLCTVCRVVVALPVIIGYVPVSWSVGRRSTCVLLYSPSPNFPLFPPFCIALGALLAVRSYRLLLLLLYPFIDKYIFGKREQHTRRKKERKKEQTYCDLSGKETSKEEEE